MEGIIGFLRNDSKLRAILSYLSIKFKWRIKLEIENRPLTGYIWMN